MSEEYKTRIEEACEAFNSAMQEIAESYRTEVIIPLCRKYNLEFTSVMGTFFFTEGGGPYIQNAEESPRKMRADLAEVFAVLNEEYSHNQCFGFLVGDVNLKDYC